MVDFERLKALGDLEGLCELLDHQDPENRSQAARILGEIGQPRSAARLVRALADEVWEVRSAVKDALICLGDAALLELEAGLDLSDTQTRRWIGETICAIGGPDATGPMTRLLNDPDDPRLRIAAVAALGTTREDSTLDILLGALTDEVWEVRQEALKGLGRLGTKEALKPICRHLEKETNGKVRTTGKMIVEQLENL